MSLAQAAHLLGPDRLARQAAGILPLTASEFAAGHGRAAVTLRLRAGGCIYLSLPDNPPGEGLPGPWLSPLLAPCTGTAALAASGWISNNPAAGADEREVSTAPATPPNQAQLSGIGLAQPRR